MKKSCSNNDSDTANTETPDSDVKVEDTSVISGYSSRTPAALSNYLSKSQEDLLGSVQLRSSPTSAKPRPRSTLGIPKGSQDYYEDFPELTVTKENRSGSQTNIARSRGGLYHCLRGSCSYDNIIDSPPEKRISPSHSESQIHRRGHYSQERFLRLSREDLRVQTGNQGAYLGRNKDLANWKRQDNNMSQSTSGIDGWSEIQSLLQQTQQENNAMKQQIDQLNQENQGLKEKLHDLSSNLERRTDSEKALHLTIDNGKGKGSVDSSSELSPKEKGSTEALVFEPASENGDHSASVAALDDDPVSAPEERLFPVEASNWEVQSLRSEGSVACLQDRIHQMEETHHSVNEELQATLQELEDMQESVGDLTFENDTLMEEKGILLEALCNQTEKLHRSKAEMEYMKEILEEHGMEYNPDAFNELYTSDKTEIEQQILDLMTSQGEESRIKDLFVDARRNKESEEIMNLREKVCNLESQRNEMEQELSGHRNSIASGQIQVDRLKSQIQHERAQTSELLQSGEKSDIVTMLENLQRDKDMLETDKGDLEEALAKSKNENAKLCNTIAKLEEESEKNKTNYNREILDLRKVIEKITAEKAELETEIANLKDSLEEMDLECERHLAEKQQDNATIAELQAAVNSMKQHKQDLEKAMNDCRRKNARDEDEWRQFQADLQTAVVIANDIRNEAQEEVEKLKKDKETLQEKIEKQGGDLMQLHKKFGLNGPTSPTEGKSRSQSILASKAERRNTETGLKRSSSGSNNVQLSVKNLVQSIENAAQHTKAAPPLPAVQQSPTAQSSERRRSIGSGGKGLDSKPSRRLSSPLLSPSEANRLSYSGSWRIMEESMARDKPFSSRYPETSPSRERHLSSSGSSKALQLDSVPKESRASTGTRIDARKHLSDIITRKITYGPQKDTKDEINGSSGGAANRSAGLHPPTTLTRRSSDTAEKKDPLAVLVKDIGGSKRNALLKWCQLKTQGYKGIDITNFSSSWNDGLAFCALIHSYLPRKIPYNELTPQDKRRNFKLAFEAGESVGIAPLLDVNDMVLMERPDWQSVMTYVTSIYKHFEG
ncbi:cytospin-A-like [Glandiceps talaboti]